MFPSLKIFRNFVYNIKHSYRHWPAWNPCSSVLEQEFIWQQEAYHVSYQVLYQANVNAFINFHVVFYTCFCKLCIKGLYSDPFYLSDLFLVANETQPIIHLLSEKSSCSLIYTLTRKRFISVRSIAVAKISTTAFNKRGPFRRLNSSTHQQRLDV